MLSEMFAELDRELTRLDSMLPTVPARAPMDVRREPDRYVVEMDLPGVDPSSIDVTLEDGWLSVRAERSTERESKDHDWVVRERSRAAVVTGFGVEDSVDADAIKAHYRDGVLTLSLPLAEHARPRKIAVNGAAPRELSAGSGASGTAAREPAMAVEAAGDEGEAQAAHPMAS